MSELRSDPRELLRDLFQKLLIQQGVDDAARTVRDAFSQAVAVHQPARSAKAEAVARGLAVRQELRNREGGHLSTAEVAKLLGTSKDTVLAWQAKGKLFGWRETVKKAGRFPIWQFEQGRILPGVAAVMTEFREHGFPDTEGVLLFFLTPQEQLEGDRPLDLARRGEIERLRILAREAALR